MEEPVVTICRKGLDNFQRQSASSKGSFNLDHEWLKIKFSTLETDFYKTIFENNIEGQDIETFKNFVVPLNNTKLNLLVRNDSVTLYKKKKIVRGDMDNEETTKDSESSIDNKK